MPPSPAHDHAHGPDPDAPPPSPEVLARRRRAVWLMLLLLVPVGLATVVGLVVLWPGDEPTRAQQVADTYLPPGTTYPDARVASIETTPCPGVDPAQPATCSTAVVEVLDGEGAGEFVQIDLPPEVRGDDVAEGDTVVLSRDPGAEGAAAYGFYDYSRDTPLVVLAVTFALVVGVVARLRGLASLLGLGFAFFVLLQFVLPGLLGDGSPVLVSLVGSAAIMFVVLYLAHGFSARTTTALVGTLFGLALVALLGAVAVSVARLTGLTSEETVTLQGYDPTLDFSGLVLAGVVVAGLGVLNDVTITQASAVWQLNEANPSMTWRELFDRGMAVGRDHIASTVYTVVFAYAGAALPLLLLFELYAQPVTTVVTSSALAEEVVRTFVGSIALVLAVPVTTAAGAFFAKAAATEAGAAPERGLSALRARFAR
ncbi:YibE/F family protein [Geodermatophilus sp. YIM 151500]|uniref:YibE/F family protein n=1 Tax=Geodermatophilus sp. YIM 151500 TaxID=2984531 RepID=UPI0021E3B3DE|nr:YibE/F family protein [Geodermatophilus sp. YIM 151500]MCV2488122.1 YibE/F family protein [Geodermatophilus sp. YIM 151500]